MRGTLVPKQDKGLEAFNRVDQQIVASVNAIESESIILAKALREMTPECVDGTFWWYPGFYRRRTPRESPLFQLLEQHFDEFERVYPDRYRERYGFFLSVDNQTFTR